MQSDPDAARAFRDATELQTLGSEISREASDFRAWFAAELADERHIPQTRLSRDPRAQSSGRVGQLVRAGRQRKGNPIMDPGTQPLQPPVVLAVVTGSLGVLICHRRDERPPVVIPGRRHTARGGARRRRRPPGAGRDRAHRPVDRRARRPGAPADRPSHGLSRLPAGERPDGARRAMPTMRISTGPSGPGSTRCASACRTCSRPSRRTSRRPSAASRDSDRTRAGPPPLDRGRACWRMPADGICPVWATDMSLLCVCEIRWPPDC